jgi:hypothetical protein
MAEAINDGEEQDRPVFSNDGVSEERSEDGQKIYE